MSVDELNIVVTILKINISFLYKTTPCAGNSDVIESLQKLCLSKRGLNKVYVNHTFRMRLMCSLSTNYLLYT